MTRAGTPGVGVVPLTGTAPAFSSAEKKLSMADENVPIVADENVPPRGEEFS